MDISANNQMVLKKIEELYDALFYHNGFGEMRIEMRFLKKGQKEIVIHCGKQYRYVVDYPDETCQRPAPGRGLVTTKT
jgi:hypothetical protein